MDHLGGSLATLVSVAGPALDTRWWHPETAGGEAPEPVRPLCQWLSVHPDRMLVIENMGSGPHLKDDEGLRLLAHRAALACALRHGTGPRALLFVFFDRPRAFTRMDYALLEAVAGFLGRMLEAEDLKQSVHRLEDALAITQAVMQDSSIRDPETDLPNLHYLEIWERALLGLEHRPASLVVAECRFHPRDAQAMARLRQAAGSIRGNDLVIRAGVDRFMVILRQTPTNRADLQLHRFLSHLGGAPMGATLWVPGPLGLGIASCNERLQQALDESLRMALPTLVWRLPQAESGPPVPSAGTGAPGVPRPWQPPILRRP